MRNDSKKHGKSIARISLLLSSIAIILACFAFYKIYKSTGSTLGNKEHSEAHVQKSDSLVNSLKDEVSRLSEKVSTISNQHIKQSEEEDIVQDSIKSVINSLSNELYSFQKRIADIEKRIEGPQKTPQKTLWYLYLGVIFSILLVFIGIFGRKKGLDKKAVDEIIDQHSDIVKMRESINDLLSNQLISAKNIESRFRILENWKNNIEKNSTKKHLSESTYNNISKKPKESNTPNNTYQRKGYAGINSERFFTNIFDSKQEACVFEISFRNENEGNFSIISLDKIKSRNGWQDVVEYDGSIEDATSFRVEENGICKKINDSTWEVTQKLKLKLLK